MQDRRSRSPFDRPQGLGSAKVGVGHWWMQRLTAVALVPLTLWIAVSLFARINEDYSSFLQWLRAPANTILMVLLLISVFYHTALGLRVVVEDYVHSEGVKISMVVAIELLCFALAIAGIVATLRIAFSG